MSVSSISTNSASNVPASVMTPVLNVDAKPKLEQTDLRLQAPDKGFKDPKKVFENLQEAIEQTNQELAKKGGNSLAFSIDKSVTIPVVSVHNMHTGELIRQIPNEVLVKSAHSIDKLKGLLWDTTS